MEEGVSNEEYPRSTHLLPSVLFLNPTFAYVCIMIIRLHYKELTTINANKV